MSTKPPSPKQGRLAPLPLPEAREAWSVRQSHTEQYHTEVWFNKQTAIERVDFLKGKGVRQANFTRISVIRCPDGKWRRIAFQSCNVHDFTNDPQPADEGAPS